MPFRAVLFDFDGTLADSYRAITSSVNHVRQLHGLTPLSVDDVKPKVGRGLPKLLQSCIPGTDLEADAQAYRDHHPTVLESGTDLLPGAAESLGELHDRGLKLGVCSNKPVSFTRSLVAILGIAPLLNEVFGPEDVPQPKPAPFMLLEAMKRFGVTEDETLYIGDMTVDVQAARAAGVAVWVVPTGSDTLELLRAAKPDRILERLDEIPRLI